METVYKFLRYGIPGERRHPTVPAAVEDAAADFEFGEACFVAIMDERGQTTASLETVKTTARELFST